jgi:hypothetical protein
VLFISSAELKTSCWNVFCAFFLFALSWVEIVYVVTPLKKNLARFWVVTASSSFSSSSSSPSSFLLLQSALQPLVGFGVIYDFVPQSSIFALLSPVSHFHLLEILFYLVKPSQSWSSYWS